MTNALIIALIVVNVLAIALTGCDLAIRYRHFRRSRQLRKQFLEAVAKGGHPQVID